MAVVQRPPSEVSRLSEALEIYNRSFRQFISTTLKQKIGSHWWEQGVVHRISMIQEDIEERGSEITSEDDALSLLEPKHYHHIVRAHRQHFRKLANSNALHIAKTGGSPRTLMHEVADWRNVCAHPPERLDSALVDRAIEAMIRVVSLFDSGARGQLDALSSKPPDAQGILDTQGSQQEETGQTKNDSKELEFSHTSRKGEPIETASLLSESKKELSETLSQLSAARNNLREIARRCKTKEAEETRAKAKINRMIETARRKAERIVETAEREAQEPRGEVRQDIGRVGVKARRDPERPRARNQSTKSETRVVPDRQPLTPPRKRTSKREASPTDAFRRQFKRAQSGNGHIRPLEVYDGWWVRCWVGQAQGVLSACVFAPLKDGLRVQEGPLMQRDFANEDEAFEWLSQACASGEIRRAVQQAIKLDEGDEVDDVPS